MRLFHSRCCDTSRRRVGSARPPLQGRSRDAGRDEPVHELSIAANVVEIARGHAARAGVGRVVAVTLRIGRLSCVHEDALRFSFDLVAADTPLAGAALRIVAVPVRIWCADCRDEFELPGIQRFACPVCGRPSGDIRAGLELDLESIELESIEIDSTSGLSIEIDSDDTAAGDCGARGIEPFATGEPPS
jgi:hydrogenase nickel incorporation protein HypA/HybF